MKVEWFNQFIFVTSVISASLVAIQCGTDLENNADAQVCRSSQENELNERRPHFVTRLVRGAADEGAAALYRLNTSTMTVEPVLVRKNSSSDAWALRDAQSGEVFFLERFLGRNKSRLTRVACDIKSSKREFGSLPPNTFGIGHIGDNSWLAAGWNDGSLTRLTKDFKVTLLDRAAPTSGVAQTPLAESDRHFNSVLVRDGRVFVLATGFDLKQFKPTQAKVMAIDDDLSKVTSVTPVSDCFNAYQDYTLQTSASEVVVGCNPQYQNATDGAPVRLIQVSILENGRVETRELARPIDQKTHIIVPGGLSLDGGWIFVTEETVTEQSAKTASPGLFRQSYWLSLKTGERRMMGQIGGRLIYDRVEDVYLLSCSAPAVPGSCKTGGFVVLKSGSWANPEAAEWKPVRFDYDFFQFERAIF